MLQLGEEPLDQVTLAAEPLAEARLPAPIALGRNVGRGALVPDQLADAVGIVSLICQHDGAWALALRQVAPWRSRPEHPEGPVQHALVIDARYASWLVGQERLDHAPLEVGQIASAHSDAESQSDHTWNG